MLDAAKKVILLTDLARERGVHPRALARAAAAGDLAVVKLGGRTYTTVEEANRFFEPRRLSPPRAERA